MSIKSEINLKAFSNKQYFSIFSEYFDLSSFSLKLCNNNIVMSREIPKSDNYDNVLNDVINIRSLLVDYDFSNKSFIIIYCNETKYNENYRKLILSKYHDASVVDLPAKLIDSEFIKSRTNSIYIYNNW